MDIASTLNQHFGSIIDSLNLFSWPEDTSMSTGNDKINFIIKKSAFQPSIKAINKTFKSKCKFLFTLVFKENKKRNMNDLALKKLLLLKFQIIFS